MLFLSIKSIVPFNIEFEEYGIIYFLWIALEDKFGSTFATKLRRSTIKFDTYKKWFNSIMCNNQ